MVHKLPLKDKSRSTLADRCLICSQEILFFLERQKNDKKEREKRSGESGREGEREGRRHRSKKKKKKIKGVISLNLRLARVHFGGLLHLLLYFPTAHSVFPWYLNQTH